MFILIFNKKNLKIFKKLFLNINFFENLINSINKIINKYKNNTGEEINNKNIKYKRIEIMLVILLYVLICFIPVIVSINIVIKIIVTIFLEPKTFFDFKAIIIIIMCLLVIFEILLFLFIFLSNIHRIYINKTHIDQSQMTFFHIDMWITDNYCIKFIRQLYL